MLAASGGVIGRVIIYQSQHNATPRPRNCDCGALECEWRATNPHW